MQQYLYKSLTIGPPWKKAHVVISLNIPGVFAAALANWVPT